ncbi:hypothetical protein ALC62_12678 [Cyphomyrmex costatus]|uniref:Uncharacterized protein n=1 Tax=Cyphomyrmex costatus TaxID=456900 RepID=A0A195C8Y5_9HYME|nr:hypothetical protein ALC62_12678 [Cyphomyrmex costatus]
MHLHRKRIAIFSIYRPPQASIAALQALEACLTFSIALITLYVWAILISIS